MPERAPVGALRIVIKYVGAKLSWRSYRHRWCRDPELVPDGKAFGRTSRIGLCLRLSPSCFEGSVVFRSIQPDPVLAAARNDPEISSLLEQAPPSGNGAEIERLVWR